MKRTLAALLALGATVAVAALVLSSANRTVAVKTGVRYVCTYGHPVGEDVKTIQVPPRDAGKYVITSKTITCDRHKRAEALYAAAQAAIAKGDLKAAEKNLSAVLELDKDFRQASGQLADIKAGKKPKPDSGTQDAASTTPPPPSKDTSKPSTPGQDGTMDEYREIVRDDIPGFRAEALSADGFVLSRSYVPGDKSRYDQLVIMVQRFSSSKEARRVIAEEIAPAYPASTKSGVKVAGLWGFRGVNGQKAAVLSLDNAGVVVSLELHATGAAPSSLYEDLARIAEQVLD